MSTPNGVLSPILEGQATIYREGSSIAQIGIAAAHGASDWQKVKQAQIDAFWNAPQTAHDWHILAAIHAAWDSMEAGQP